MRQLLLDLLPEVPPSLDNYIIGSNGETLTGLAAWLAPGNSESSLFLWGNEGAGKTHLLHASGAHYSNAAIDSDLASIDRRHDFYAVDNVTALSETGQIVLFNLFNRLRVTGGRLLTSANQPPRQIALREDLRTRLGSGLIYRLHALTDDEKIDALTAQAAARGLDLPPETLNYLLARLPRDMRILTAFLVALDRYSLEHKRAITLPLLREVLHNSPDI